jgi:PAS domain S-box-containing protein
MIGLKQSEEKYRGIVENALEGVYQSSLEGRFLSANPAMAQILGYASPQELMTSITDIRHQFYVDPADRDVLLKAIMAERKAFGFEVQIYRKDGRIIWVAISARLRYDASGAPEAIEGFLSDITIRKHAEEALSESRNYLDEIINSAGDPLFVKDENHRWVLVNNAFCTMMGYPREQLIGKSDYDFIPREQADVFWAKDAEVFASGKENLNEELFTDSHGVTRTILTKKTLYTDKNGEQFIVGSISDVTERKQQEEEKIRLLARLNQAQKMEAIGALAGGIAHDFNNILQPMLGYSEMLGLRLPPDSPHRRYVERLQTAGLRAKELVSHILAFSRQTEHQIIPVRLQKILKEVVQLCRSTIPANIEIVTDLQRDCPPVSVDPSQVHQVAMNLIVNAFHAVEATGGKIIVGVHEETLLSEEVGDLSLKPGKHLTLTITDTGCGIPPEVRDRIFEPYFTTKEQGKGTGLGLAVVHGIVKEWQGDIAIASVVGKGTTIKVYLPLPEQSGETEAMEAMPHYPGGHERILFVDDEAMIVELAALLLKELGYQVTSRMQSRQALELFAADPQAFDLVITDMMMPEMTGDQLARKLLAISPDLPIIMCSGFSEQIGTDEILAIGVKELLKKPITIAELSQKVRAVLDAARSTRKKKSEGEQCSA